MPDWLFVLVLISLGFILLLLELLTPGFALMGIAGFAFLAYGSYLSYVKLSLLWGILVSLAVVITVVFILKLFPKSSAWKRLRLDTVEEKKEGFSGTEIYDELLGKEGLTISELRPTGIALIGAKRHDVLADGEFVEKDKQIIVTKVEGNKIIVREKKEV